MDEPVPIRRAAVGCLVLAVAVVAVALLVRPAIFSVAPPRDDGAVIAASLTEVSSGPVVRDLVLARSHGWSGERDAGEGRVQVGVVIAQTGAGGVVAVNAASPVTPDCPVTPAADRLVDCEGRAWSFEGFPLDPADPELERIAVEVEGGSVVLDMTRPLDDG